MIKIPINEHGVGINLQGIIKNGRHFINPVNQKETLKRLSLITIILLLLGFLAFGDFVR